MLNQEIYLLVRSLMLDIIHTANPDTNLGGLHR